MKQLAQYQDGRLEFQEVPPPVAPPRGVLVRTTHSIISPGTERMKVEQARMNLMQKALARPDQVRKVLDTARNLGWRNALEKVRNRLETPTPLGYSAAGVVVEVDGQNTRFRVGDRVACGGAECAFHAEYVAIPDMLAAPVPAEVESWQAAYTTLCAIAMQAVRQGDPRIGDRALVIGQGMIGLLVTALLRANGARVMGVDVLESRRPLAEAMGAERLVIAGQQKPPEEARLWTGGGGVDLAFVCTAAFDNTPVEQAGEALRDRGRLIIVGITKVELPQKMFYEKELEVRYSRAYGPGRYDAAYEWGGADYPIGYVRWTEQRNFQACLHLMAAGQLDLTPLTTRTVAFTNALSVYQDLLSGKSTDVGVVLAYGSESSGPVKSDIPRHWVKAPDIKRIPQPVARLDVIGAGNFARTMLLPHLQGKIDFGTIVNQTALSANHVKNKFGFRAAETEAGKVFQSKEAAAVLIATRHHLHAPLVSRALAAGHHIFVEKPLCLTVEELSDIDEAVASTSGSVMVGFNRRFAPATIELKRRLAAVSGPKWASCRVLAGPIDPKHWYANPAESGGRFVGEACHFLDYFCFLFGSVPMRVTAQPIWPPTERAAQVDSVAAQIEFADGSCAQLVYSAAGDSTYPKETLTVLAGGLTAELVNFQRVTVYQNRKRQRSNFTSKGHAEEMAAWLAFLRGGAPHPSPYAEARQSMLLTFAALRSIQLNQSVAV